jgi:hypothetical protein
VRANRPRLGTRLGDKRALDPQLSYVPKPPAAPATDVSSSDATNRLTVCGLRLTGLGSPQSLLIT